MTPQHDGWYNVTFEPGEPPVRAYIRVASVGILWGWDEQDDPELIPMEDINDVFFEEAVQEPTP